MPKRVTTAPLTSEELEQTLVDFSPDEVLERFDEIFSRDLDLPESLEELLSLDDYVDSELRDMFQSIIAQYMRPIEFAIQQMDVQTYFFRRSNMNALGQPRSWTDHLLWHHAAHTVDLFRYQAGSEIIQANAVQGPIHPELGIAMDMSIQLKASTGAICTLSLSFNNDGPLGTFFRYIGDSGTYIARYDDLVDGKDNKIDVSKVDVSMNGIELQDREFFAAIRDNREPNASVAQVLPCYRTLHQLEQQLQSA